MTAVRSLTPGLEGAALAPMGRSGRGHRVILLLLMVLTASGIGAFIYQFSTGIGVTGMNDRVFWGIYTVDLVTLIGFSYGGALVSAILRLTNASWRGPISRLAEGTALATLAVGALFPLASDGHPERVWRLVTAMQINSPIMWDMVAIVTYLIATIILFALPAVADLGRLQGAPGLEGWRRRRPSRLATFGRSHLRVTALSCASSGSYPCTCAIPTWRSRRGAPRPVRRRSGASANAHRPWRGGNPG